MTGDSAYPEILGVYSQNISSELGAGSTRTDHQNVTYWYVRQLSEDRFEVQPLTAEGLPSGMKKSVGFKDFIISFSPEPFYYAENPVEVVKRLENKLLDGDSEEDFDLKNLDQKELAALRAVMVDPLDIPNKASPGGAKEHQAVLERVRALFSQLMFRCAVCKDEHRVRFNDYGVTLRRQGHHDQSLGFLNKALAIEKNDEHLYFNIARTCFDMGDLAKCREVLMEALRIKPDFVEAAKFLQYLSKQEAAAG